MKSDGKLGQVANNLVILPNLPQFRNDGPTPLYGNGTARMERTTWRWGHR